MHLIKELSNYMKKKLAELKREQNKSTVMNGDYNTPPSLMIEQILYYFT